MIMDKDQVEKVVQTLVDINLDGIIKKIKGAEMHSLNYAVRVEHSLHYAVRVEHSLHYEPLVEHSFSCH